MSVKFELRMLYGTYIDRYIAMCIAFKGVEDGATSEARA